MTTVINLENVDGNFALDYWLSNAVLHMSRTQFNQLDSSEVWRLTQLNSTDIIWSGWGVLHAWPVVNDAWRPTLGQAAIFNDFLFKHIPRKFSNIRRHDVQTNMARLMGQKIYIWNHYYLGQNINWNIMVRALKRSSRLQSTLWSSAWFSEWN